MAWHLITQGDDQNSNYMEFLLDNESDINSPPTSIYSYSLSSIAHTPGFTKVWECDANGNWIEVVNSGGGGGGASTAIVAPQYSDLTFPVSKGQHCIYNDGYYEANTNIATPESWTSAHWTQLTIGGEAQALKTAIQGLDDDFDNAVFFEETQDDDSIEGIIKSEIKSKMRFSLSGNTLSINYDGETVTTVTLPSTQPIPCTDIELNIAVKSIEAGETFNLTATVTPSNTTDSVTWESSDDSVASVLNGVVTGVASGTATIKVSCGSYSDTCVVTVTAFYTNLVLGNVLSDNDKLRYRSGYSYKQGCTFNDPFLYKLSSGQKIKVVKVQAVTNLYVSLYAYGTGTFTNKVEADGDNYVLTNDMIGMEDGSSYNILTSSSKLYGYSEYLDNWAGDYTATQDCYVALHFLIVNSDLTDRLNEIKSAVRIEVE